MLAIGGYKGSGSMWISVYEAGNIIPYQGRQDKKGDVLAVAQVAGIQGPREPAI